MKTAQRKVNKKKFIIILATPIIIGLAVSILLFSYRYVSKNPELHAYIANNYPEITNLAKSSLKITDIFYMDSFFRKDDVKTLYLELPWKDLTELNQALPEKIKTKALLKANNNKYNVEIKYRGGTSIHWENQKKSIRITLTDGQLFENMSSFHLIIPEDRGYLSEDFSYYLARKLGLITFKSDFYKLYINKKYNGLYYVAEHPTLAFLKRNNLNPNGNIYNNETDEDTEQNGFKYANAWEKTYANPDMKKNDMSEIELLLKHIKEDLPPENIIDIDNFLRWNAHSILVNSTHQTNGGNIKMYFNPDTKKFIFFPWDTAQQAHEAIEISSNSLIPYILKNPEYLHKRNLILWDYLKDENNLADDLNYMDNKFQYIKNAMYKDNKKDIPNITFNKWYEEYKTRTVERYKTVKNALNDSEIDLSVKIINEKTLALGLVSKRFAAAFINFNNLKNNIYKNADCEIYEDLNNNNIVDSEDKIINEIQILYSDRDLGTGSLNEIKIIPKKYNYLIKLKGADLNENDLGQELHFDITNAVTNTDATINTQYHP